MKALTLFLLLFPSLLFGQNATFSIDTFRDKDAIEEMEWKINGKILNSSNRTIEVKVSKNKLDTIYYKERKNSDWVPMICKIEEPENYKFRYNPCCGGFNVYAKNSVCIANVIFKINDNFRKKTFIGVLDETAMIVSANDTIIPICKSAMAPNICNIQFGNFKLSQDTASYENQYCLYDKNQYLKKALMSDEAYEQAIETGKIQTTINFDFTSTKLNILYLPLNNKYLEINYNPKTGVVLIK